ncbi:hypothetical protein GS640_01445 [Rhodococcus hoagii]|nr:hypothetical protein [Prescottella equi]
MADPQSIEVDYDQASGAATELKDAATKVEGLSKKFEEVVEAFKADARLEGEVMPASQATLDELTKLARTVRNNVSAIFDSVDRAGNALNGRVAEAQSSDAQSSAEINAVDGHTPQ